MASGKDAPAPEPHPCPLSRSAAVASTSGRPHTGFRPHIEVTYSKRRRKNRNTGEDADAAQHQAPSTGASDQSSKTLGQPTLPLGQLQGLSSSRMQPSGPELDIPVPVQPLHAIAPVPATQPATAQQQEPCLQQMDRDEHETGTAGCAAVVKSSLPGGPLLYVRKRVAAAPADTPPAAAQPASRQLQQQQMQPQPQPPARPVITQALVSAPNAVAPRRPLMQLHLDAGQANFAHTTCKVCGLVYAQGEERDEKVHAAFHSSVLQGIRFQGWQNERVIKLDGSKGRILLVHPTDSAAHLKKVKDISTFLEEQMGLVAGWLLSVPCKVFLYISAGKRMVGCVVTERISLAHPVIACEQDQTADSGWRDVAQRLQRLDPDPSLDQPVASLATPDDSGSFAAPSTRLCAHAADAASPAASSQADADAASAAVSVALSAPVAGSPAQPASVDAAGHVDPAEREQATCHRQVHSQPGKPDSPVACTGSIQQCEAAVGMQLCAQPGTEPDMPLPGCPERPDSMEHEPCSISAPQSATCMQHEGPPGAGPMEVDTASAKLPECQGQRSALPATTQECQMTAPFTNAGQNGSTQVGADADASLHASMQAHTPRSQILLPPTYPAATTRSDETAEAVCTPSSQAQAPCAPRTAAVSAPQPDARRQSMAGRQALSASPYTRTPVGSSGAKNGTLLTRWLSTNKPCKAGKAQSSIHARQPRHSGESGDQAPLHTPASCPPYFRHSMQSRLSMTAPSAPHAASEPAGCGGSAGCTGAPDAPSPPTAPTAMPPVVGRPQRTLLTTDQGCPTKAICGVRLMWVSLEARGQGIASQLLDMARCNCLAGYIVPRHELAFSQPTSDGQAFAARYTGTKAFLVYT